MNRIDIILRIIALLYVRAKRKFADQTVAGRRLNWEDTMTRQEVKEFLHISESTYKRKVKDGTLRPMKLPGGDRYYKSELMRQWRYHWKRRRGD